MKLVYFDCFNGASGDMILGALLDSGVPRAAVDDALAAIGLSSALAVEETSKGSIRATRVRVVPEDTTSTRSYRDIVTLLEGSQLAPRIKQRALDVFERLASAEARIHATPAQEVHFHEVGGLDAIIDIIGTCAALEYLEPQRVVSSSIPTGRGFADSLHGKIPVPAPAVTELLGGAVLYARGDKELITPTGAALLASWCDSFGEMPPLKIERVGWGAGTLDTEVPNVLRVLVGEQRPAHASEERVEIIETNIDDMAPELMPYVIERLMGAGALDAWVTPIMMKKGRHAMTLAVLCDALGTQDLLDIIFTETTTLGVRIGPIDREVLDRKENEVVVHGHRIRVKLGIRHGRVVTVAPEYEDAAIVARATGIPLKDIYDAARSAAPKDL